MALIIEKSQKAQETFGPAPFWELFSQAVGLLLHWKYMQWIRLLVTEKMAIAAAARSPEDWEPLGADRARENGKSLLRRCVYDEERVSWKAVSFLFWSRQNFHQKIL